MKKINLLQASVVLVTVFVIMSCKKEQSVSSSSTSSSLQNVISNLQAIGVGTTSSTSSSQEDSIYVINTCQQGHYKDSVSFGNLPTAITDYLSANYSGYSFQKAFTDKDQAGTLQGFVIVILYNGNPVGLKFDAQGNFVKVLEQREGRDLEGSGWHEGGHFGDRDGHERDTIALISLPASVQSYFTTNYPQDTLVKAFQSNDGSIVVLSKNNGAFATVFAQDGSFVKRIQLPSPGQDGKLNVIDQSSLPASVQGYLSSTYTGYTFKQAFSLIVNGTIQGYIVFINANSTKYAVSFDAAGNFVRAVVVR